MVCVTSTSKILRKSPPKVKYPLALLTAGNKLSTSQIQMYLLIVCSFVMALCLNAFCELTATLFLRQMCNWHNSCIALTLQDVELDSVPGESPYIGKARYKRNMFITEGYIASKAQQMGTGKMQSDENDLCMKSQLEPQFQTLDEQLESKEKKIHSGNFLILKKVNIAVFILLLELLTCVWQENGNSVSKAVTAVASQPCNWWYRGVKSVSYWIILK